MTDHHLKQHLFDEYSGFADKRIKNLDKADTFIVDDRGDTDNASDGSLYSYFCMIFAKVVSPDTVEVQLIGNIPMGPAVSAWIDQHRPELRDGMQASMSFRTSIGEEGKLDDLGAAIRSIVRPGGPRYKVASYKYVCPRTADSLDRLARTLRAFTA
jgi:hypothetical protein